MSQWTHLAGTIRVDGFTLDPEQRANLAGTIRACVGPTCGFADQEESWSAVEDAKMVPLGSEGSARWKWQPYERDSSVMLGQINIWADLRGVGEDPAATVEEMRLWVEKICSNLKKASLSVRDAVLMVNIEYKGQWVVYLKEEEHPIEAKVISTALEFRGG